MFHITPKGNLAVNGELTGDDLESSQKDYCVEAHIRKGTFINYVCKFSGFLTPSPLQFAYGLH